ncbi:protein kinase [Saccharomycopsis crataegensis]|uniref:Protein kinase n=1 Tax=Saccharomycopsis crataegensis TaxID=43959 RepID=A0AAV5QTC2_9ASCO|nr:protein kinase [Saccharomycopsis crataegensis]
MNDASIKRFSAPPKISFSYPPDIHTPPKHIPLKSLKARYHVISNLGNGSFGSVVLAKRAESYQYSADKMSTLMNPIAGCTDLSTPLVAIKTMNKTLPKLKDYTKVKEVKFILSIPSHVNLVFIHEMFVDNVDFKLHIVMETMDQNLYQFMRFRKGQLFSENSVKSILAQILAAVGHIHKHGYFHRDLKPENILISYNSSKNGYYPQVPGQFRPPSYIVKLADYGLARNIDNKRPYTAYVSTRWYRSPEILLRQKHYSRPIDIWAFGAVAAEVTSFRPLFPGNNELDQTCKILEVLGSPYMVDDNIPLGGFWADAQVLANKLGFQLPYSPGIRIENIIQRPELAQLRDVVKACLTWDPNLRIDVERLCRMPYFCGTIVNPYSESINSKPFAIQNPSIATTQGMMMKSELLSGIKPVSSANNKIVRSPGSLGNSTKPKSGPKQKSLLLKKSAHEISPISYRSDYLSKERKIQQSAVPQPQHQQHQQQQQSSSQPFEYSPVFPVEQSLPSLQVFAPRIASPNAIHQSPGKISLISTPLIRNNQKNSSNCNNSFLNDSFTGGGFSLQQQQVYQQTPNQPFQSPQTNSLSHCNSASDSIMTNNYPSRHIHDGQAVASLRNSYQNYSSSIESEGFGLDNEVELGKKQSFYYDNYYIPNYSVPMGDCGKSNPHSFHETNDMDKLNQNINTNNENFQI